jgi:hypothetical protein
MSAERFYYQVYFAISEDVRVTKQDHEISTGDSFTISCTFYLVNLDAYRNLERSARNRFIISCALQLMRMYD